MGLPELRSLFFLVKAWLPSGRQVTPLLSERATLCAASGSFAKASEVLAHLTGVSLSAWEIHGLSQEVGDAAQAPEQASSRAVEDAKRAYRGGWDVRRVYAGFDGVWVDSRESDSGMEGKVGILFEEGASNVSSVSRNRRMLLSKRYVGSFDGWEVLGEQTDRRVWREGWGGVPTTVYGDGASWIASLRERVLPGSVLVLDWWHLKEPVRRGLRAVLSDDAERERIETPIRESLGHGRWEEAIETLSTELPSGLRDGEKVESLRKYLWNHRSAIVDYSPWRVSGRRVGTSVVEKTGDLVIARRMKHQGMCWSREGADRMTALRLAMLNGEWDAMGSDWEAA